MILYADILFLVDFSMDFLTLRLCARITHEPVPVWRMILAAVLGSIGGVLLVVWGADGAVVFWAGIMLSVLMTAVCFGIYSTGRRFLRHCLLIWGCGAVTGGCMSFLLSLGTPVYVRNSTGEISAFLPVFFLTVIFVRYFSGILTKRSGMTTAQLIMVYHGSRACCTVLVDSGNLLTDPLTGKPVILVSKQAMMSLSLPTHTETENMLLPVLASGVNGTRLLWAVKPESLYINGRPRDALVAAEDVPADHFGGCGGTCPASLL